MPREYRPVTINTSSFHHSEAGIVDADTLIGNPRDASPLIRQPNPVRVQADTQVPGQMVPAIRKTGDDDGDPVTTPPR